MNKPQAFYVLAFDTSTPKGKCSALCPNEAEGEVLLSEDIRISKTLLPQVEQLLISRNIDTNMIQAIGVSIGPGTFTGLRVGLSCAKGLSLGLGCPLYGFSSLEIMAMDALLNEIRTGRCLPDYILPYRDARYGELFTALFEVSGNPELSGEFPSPAPVRTKSSLQTSFAPQRTATRYSQGKKRNCPKATFLKFRKGQSGTMRLIPRPLRPHGLPKEPSKLKHLRITPTYR